MTNDDLNQIRGVVKEEINSALEPIKETLANHTKTLANHTKTLANHTKTLANHTKILTDHTKKLDTLWDQAVELTENMAETQETLNSYTTALTRSELTIAR